MKTITLILILLAPSITAVFAQAKKQTPITCTVVDVTIENVIVLWCANKAQIQYQLGHWPEEWKGGPVLGGQHDALFIPGEPVLVVDGLVEEGQAVGINGRINPVLSDVCRSNEFKPVMPTLEPYKRLPLQGSYWGSGEPEVKPCAASLKGSEVP